MDPPSVAICAPDRHLEWALNPGAIDVGRVKAAARGPFRPGIRADFGGTTLRCEVAWSACIRPTARRNQHGRAGFGERGSANRCQPQGARADSQWHLGIGRVTALFELAFACCLPHASCASSPVASTPRASVAKGSLGVVMSRHRGHRVRCCSAPPHRWWPSRIRHDCLRATVDLRWARPGVGCLVPFEASADGVRTCAARDPSRPASCIA